MGLEEGGRSEGEEGSSVLEEEGSEARDSEEVEVVEGVGSEELNRRDADRAIGGR